MLKDNFNTMDMQTTAGSVALKGWVPPTDSFVTKRIRDSGAIILAKTNLHEFAIWGESISSILGQAVNPYDPTRTPGGSSGGVADAFCDKGIRWGHPSLAVRQHQPTAWWVSARL